MEKVLVDHIFYSLDLASFVGCLGGWVTVSWFFCLELAMLGLEVCRVNVGRRVAVQKLSLKEMDRVIHVDKVMIDYLNLGET